MAATLWNLAILDLSHKNALKIMKEHIRKHGLFFVNKQNDYFNRTILMYAALKRQYEVVNYLVLEGANCFLKDYIGSTLIDIIFEQWDEVRREALLDIIR